MIRTGRHKAAPRLAAIGDNCLDVFLGKDLVTVGGNALNVAAQWRQAGWNARYFGAAGDDLEGDLLLAEVAATGLDPADIERRAGDSFIAAFLTAFKIEGLDAGAALAASARAAALTCTHIGGFPQTPRPIPHGLPAKYAAVLDDRRDD
jgi:sugar/nucleoside kinase (ribokinase family)